MPSGSPSVDSCLEYFFRPDIEDERHMNFEFNRMARFYVGIDRTVDNLVRLIPDGWNPLEAKSVYTIIWHRIPFRMSIPRSTSRRNLARKRNEICTMRRKTGVFYLHYTDYMPDYEQKIRAAVQ